MNTPPFLLAAAALFWGSQTGNWLLAMASAALLEAPRHFSARWQLESSEFNRVSDFCTVLLVVLAAYLYFTFGNPRAITLLFQWLPLVLLPLALAQAWSTTPELKLSVLFGTLRRNPMRRTLTLNLAYPAFALWLLSASAANRQTAEFYPVLTLLIAWPLLLARPRSHSLALAACMLAAAALAGYGGHIGLHQAQLWLEAAAPEWMAGGGARTNPYRSVTDIGSIGDLKLSQRILLRVVPDPAMKTPILLHRASYNDYVSGTWVARNARFEPIAAASDAVFGAAALWNLNASPGPFASLTVHDHSNGNPVLSLPANTARIADLAASEMRANALGAVQIERKPGFFSYRAQIGGDAAHYGPPAAPDLLIAKAESAAVGAIAGELGLATLPPEEALARVKQFFAERFEYSTWQGAPVPGRTPLARFLLTTRTGHCEYFASATVLLLRAAGIPARYATGFSVQEWSRLDEAYVVREAHAHAWVRAWVGGAWRDIDTTPPTWFTAEAAGSPLWSTLWSPLADLWSWARFRLAAWSARADEGGWSDALLWLALPLIAWLAWRTLRGRRAKAVERTQAAASDKLWPGLDSEFYLIERRLAQLGHARAKGEAVSEWLARIAAQAGTPGTDLHLLARLHYRYRFDPAGLPATERELLRTHSRAWLAQHPER